MLARPAPPGLRSVRRSLRHLIPVFVILAVLAGAGFAALETDNVRSYWDGVWWALSLMTTVGFIGETPETTGGRVLSAFLMVAGFGLLSMTTAVIASRFVREDEQPESDREQAFEHVALARLDDLAERLERIERGLPPTADGDEPRE